MGNISNIIIVIVFISLGEKEYEEGPLAGQKLPKHIQLLGVLLTGATVVSLPIVALQQLSKSVPSLIQPSEKFRRPECRSPSAILVTSENDLHSPQSSPSLS